MSAKTGKLDRASADGATKDGGRGDGTRTDPCAENRDLVYVHSVSTSGQGYNVIRTRNDTVEVGELRTLQHGRPVTGEIVGLSPAEHEQLFEVEVLAEAPRSSPPRKGPAQVASAAYRDHWEQIFGEPSGQDLN